MKQIVLLRHGQSLWNLENRFTGWADVDLSENGEKEARDAGRLLASSGLHFDEAHTSLLKRAIRTLWLVQEELDQCWLPTYKTWLLNERHYGALEGLNKAETAERYSPEQVFKWRRGYTVRPPELKDGDQRLPSRDPRYAAVKAEKLPRTESLADTCARVQPYLESTILPALRNDKKMLIVAHGNALRGLIKILSNIGDGEITTLEIPTGRPLIYEFSDDCTPKGYRYL